MMNLGESSQSLMFNKSLSMFGVQEDSTTITPVKQALLCKIDGGSMGKRGKFLAVNDNDRSLTVTEGKPTAIKGATNFKSKVKASQFDTTYSKDYFNFMKTKEIESVVDAGYLSRQREVNFSDRMVMVDYIIEIQNVMKLSMNTVYLAITYIDKLLALVIVNESDFQLVGLITLLIASKMEDLHSKAINARIIARLMSLPVDIDRIVDTERAMLETSFFKMGLLTRYNYVEKLMKVFKSEKNKRFFESLVLMTLYSFSLSSVRPSTVIHCVLEQMQQISEDEKLGKMKSCLDCNGDFEAAKDYLGVRIVHTQDYEACCKSLGEIMSLIRKEEFPGFEKACGDIIHKVKAMPLGRH